ncbi:MAG: hypothetical protein IJZ21_06445 [Clostridia bacterium]|nr:hypothetical protein [Clostridia bacterium]
MNEFENNNNQNNDTLSGFDNDTGYTVTPNGSFYSKKSEDIIQDEATQNTPPQYEPPKAEYQAPPTYTTSYNNYNQNPQRPQKPKKEKRGHSTAVVIIACVLAAIIGAVSYAIVGSIPIAKPYSTTDDYEKTVEKPSNNVNINVDETASSIAEAVAVKCTDSVVGIRTTTSVSSFFGGSQEQTGDGSGVVYTADGYIITNYHVIISEVE